MIDYLLIHPKIDEHGGDQFIPLGMMKVGAFFERNGKNNVMYWDQRCDSLKDLLWAARNMSHPPKIYFSTMSGSQWKNAQKLMRFLVKYTEKNHFLVGGYMAYNYLHGNPKPKLKHKHYGLSFEEWRFDLQDPITAKTKRFYKLFKPLLFTSFGCPNHCLFCTVRGKWTPVPLEQIEKELDIITEAGYRFITVGDPNFGGNSYLRIKAISKLMSSHKVKWHCNLAIKTFKKKDYYFYLDKLSYMNDFGCVSIEVGLESGNKSKRSFLKGHTIAIREIERFNYWTNNYFGISVMYSFIVGFPTETTSNIMDTMNLIDEIRKSNKGCYPKARFSIYSYVPYPSALTKRFPNIPTHNYDMAWHPLYWIAGLKFRKDNVKKNFPKWKRLLALPFEVWAHVAWELRILRFPKKVFEWILSVMKR